MRLVAQPLQNSLTNARFADAWLTGDQDHLPVAALGLCPSANEQVDLLVATNEGSRCRAHRFKPALDTARAQHLPRGDILGEALQGDVPEVAVLEQATDQFSRARRNDNCARLGQGLEPGGEVGRLTHDPTFLGLPGADEIANYD